MVPGNFRPAPDQADPRGGPSCRSPGERIREEIARARWAGTTPWESLTELAQEISLPELAVVFLVLLAFPAVLRILNT